MHGFICIYVCTIFSQKVQKALLQSDVQSKSDKSPVTVADYGLYLIPLTFISAILISAINSRGYYYCLIVIPSAALRT